MPDSWSRSVGALLAAVVACLVAAAWATTALAQGSADSGYRVNPGDELRVEVIGHATLSATVAVDDQGSITLPSVGTLRAAGRTTADLAADISRRVSLTLRETPQVRVTVVEARSQRIFVLGSVLLPGAYSFREDPSVWEAISEGGGPSDDADLAAVEVIPGAASGRPKFTVDVAAAIRSGSYGDLPRLKPGDTVRVPRAFSTDAGEGTFVFVLGAVAAQGPLALAAPWDLVSTVTRSAPTADADLSNIEIVRRTGGRLVQMRVNARDYISEAEATGNPQLEPGDTIYVPREGRGFGLLSILGVVSPLIGLATSIVLLAR